MAHDCRDSSGRENLLTIVTQRGRRQGRDGGTLALHTSSRTSFSKLAGVVCLRRTSLMMKRDTHAGRLMFWNYA